MVLSWQMLHIWNSCEKLFETCIIQSNPTFFKSGHPCCNSCQLGRLRPCKMWYRWCKESYLDLKKTNLFGQDRKRMMISIVNQALHTHSTKKKAWWALVWYLSNVQTVVLKEVRTVIFLITGTLISGLVLRQKETIDTTIKNTEITPITWKINENRCYGLFYRFYNLEIKMGFFSI